MFNAKRLLTVLLSAGIYALIISGCGSNTEITHSYVNPELDKLDLEGVMVVGVAQQQTARVKFEDDFARALRRFGVRVQASHTLVPQEKATAEEIIAAAKNADLDTILVTRYIGQSTEEVYHPGTIYYGVTPAYGGRHNGRFGGYYAHAYEVAYEQPVWTSNVTHTLVSDLYATATKEHLWQAVSETLQAGSNEKLRDNAIKGLIGNLKEQGLLR
jgi:hypothetical protein